MQLSAIQHRWEDFIERAGDMQYNDGFSCFKRLIHQPSGMLRIGEGGVEYDRRVFGAGRYRQRGAPTWLPMLHAIRIDGRVLLFSAAISLLTGLIFGVIPAAQGSKAAFVESLKAATRGGTVGGARGALRVRLRAALVAGQLAARAAALALLIGAGLSGRCAPANRQVGRFAAKSLTAYH